MNFKLKMMRSVQNATEMFTFEIDSAAESENALVTVGSESSLSCASDTGTLKRFSVPVTQPGSLKSP